MMVLGMATSGFARRRRVLPIRKRARGVRKQHYAPMPQQDAIVQMAKRGDPDSVFSKALRVLRTQAQTAAA